METKLKTYLRFNETYPGFGGFLPWVKTDKHNMTPNTDWDNLVPGLDNGELLWAVYGCIEALEGRPEPKFQDLAKSWQNWFDYVSSTAAKVFYIGKGKVCAVTEMKNQSLPVNHPSQTYKCETKTYLDDPYEGELLTYFLQFFSDLSDANKKKLWEYKRPKLESDEYDLGGVGPITVRKGKSLHQIRHRLLLTKHS